MLLTTYPSLSFSTSSFSQPLPFLLYRRRLLSSATSTIPPALPAALYSDVLRHRADSRPADEPELVMQVEKAQGRSKVVAAMPAMAMMTADLTSLSLALSLDRRK